MKTEYISTTVSPCHSVKPCRICGGVPLLVLNKFVGRYGAYMHCPNDCKVTAMRHADMDRTYDVQGAISREVMGDWKASRFL